MNTWLKKIENIMAAAAFAQAGEFETAREFLKEPRKIILALSGAKADINAFRYAMNSCKRMGAKLEILYVSKLPKHVIRKFRAECKKDGIDYRLIQKSGPLEEEIRNHASMQKDILFVVVEVSGDVEIHSAKADKIIANAWDNLKCPLVVVSQDGKFNHTHKENGTELKANR